MARRLIIVEVDDGSDPENFDEEVSPLLMKPDGSGELAMVRRWFDWTLDPDDDWALVESPADIVSIVIGRGAGAAKP